MSECACAGCFRPAQRKLCPACADAGCPMSGDGPNAIFDETACLVRRKVLKVRDERKKAQPTRPTSGSAG